MTKEQVSNTLIDFLKKAGAVDPNLSHAEIAQIKLPELAWFRQELRDDPEFKKEVLYKRMVDALKEITGGREPVLSPQDETIFDRDISIDTLAGEIAEDF